MHFRSLLTSFVNNLCNSLSLRAAIGAISLVAAYLKFRDAGYTPLFWGLILVTLTFAILTLVPTLRKVIKIRRRRKDRESGESIWKSHRLRTLTALIDEFKSVEKSKALSSAIDKQSPIRVLAIRSVPSQLGVILNIGSKENVEVGTQLVAFRTDERTHSGEDVEKPLAVVEVTYVQVGNNCSQAAVIQELDKEFWDHVRSELLNSNSISPPRNFAVPYVPMELENISLEDISVFREFLQRIRNRIAVAG
jgi:hypothetical protein